MAESEPKPLTREQLIAAAAQLDNLHGALQHEPAPSVGTEKTRASAILGFAKSMAAIGDLTKQYEVLEAYSNAFLIAAGVKQPVITIGNNEIRLNLQRNLEGGK